MYIYLYTLVCDVHRRAAGGEGTGFMVVRCMCVVNRGVGRSRDRV